MNEPRSCTLSADDQQTLLGIVVDSLQHYFDDGTVVVLDPLTFSPALRESQATFVTLRIDGELRGCCGSLRPREPLCRNVARSALSAAFADHRFSALEKHELNDLDVHISLLSIPEPFPILTEADLLAGIRPGIHGVILTEESRQGVFLPSVWEQVPEPREFVRRLKQKAGWPSDYWSPWIRAERFIAESIHGPAAASRRQVVMNRL